jgi:hypothetical protein
VVASSIYFLLILPFIQHGHTIAPVYVPLIT